jgi:predicted Zn-dependent protease
VLCKEGRPSANVYLQSWIERVPITPAVSQQLNSATSTSNSLTKRLRDRASIYARSGLWYDALADLSTAQTLNPNEQSLKEDFLSLLDQVGLTEVALQERQRLAKN